MGTPNGDRKRRNWIERLYDWGGLSGPVMVLLVICFPPVPVLPGRFWTGVGTGRLFPGLLPLSLHHILR